MILCDKSHPPNALCTDRKCYWTIRNPFWRLQRRYDRLSRENQRLRGLWEKMVSKGGGV